MTSHWRSHLTRWLSHRAAQLVLVLLALLPFMHLVYGVFANTLGANPAETLVSTATRDAFIASVVAYDQAGLAIWRRVLDAPAPADAQA